MLLGNITNLGAKTDTFVAIYKIILQDSHGRQYDDDTMLDYNAMEKYGAQFGAEISPEASQYIAFAYDVPATETQFKLVRGSLVSSWSGDISFTTP